MQESICSSKLIETQSAVKEIKYNKIFLTLEGKTLHK